MINVGDMAWAQPIVVAEIGCNHGGDFAKAREMVECAVKWCGARIVKGQKRDVEALSEAERSKPRNDVHAFGATEYAHRKALELSIEQHAELKTFAESLGASYTLSAWDQRSMDQVVGLGVDYVKVPSAKNEVCWSWKTPAITPLHVSLGMTDHATRMMIFDKMPHGAVPYACTSAYPCENSDVYLGEVAWLAEMFPAVGFSGHHRGIQLDIAAFTLGATIIERHFTLDRASKGTDHAASLEPEGLRKLVRDLTIVAGAMKGKPRGLPPAEVACRKKMKGF